MVCCCLHKHVLKMASCRGHGFCIFVCQFADGGADVLIIFTIFAAFPGHGLNIFFPFVDGGDVFKMIFIVICCIFSIFVFGFFQHVAGHGLSMFCRYHNGGTVFFYIFNCFFATCCWPWPQHFLHI